PARAADDLFRMPVDRAFTIKGTGTVVTGTVWSGRLTRDATVRVLPADRAVRVRGLQTHGDQVEAASPGHRTAIALAGIDVADVHRGSFLVTDGAWRTSTVLRADVVLLDDAPKPLRARTAVRTRVRRRRRSNRGSLGSSTTRTARAPSSRASLSRRCARSSPRPWS